MAATLKQKICSWYFFKHFEGKGSTASKKKSFLEYFGVKSLNDISKEQLWQYIGNMPTERRVSAGFFEEQEFMADWGNV